MKQGIIWRIGNGRATGIWEHNWLPRDNLLRALHPRSADPPAMVVADLIDEVTRTWDRAQVYEHVEKLDADVVMNIPLFQHFLPMYGMCEAAFFQWWRLLP